MLKDKIHIYWITRKKTWALWGIMTCTLLLKMLFFHIAFFGEVNGFFPISNSLLYAMAVATVALLCKKKWPLFAVIALLDLWMVANVLYYRANGLLVTVDAVKLIGQLTEFTGSLATYTVPLMWVNTAFGIAAMVGIYFMPKSEKRMPLETAVIILLTYMVTVIPDGKRFYEWEYKPNAEAIKFYADLDDYGTVYRQDHTCGRYGELCFLPYNQARISGMKGCELTAEDVRANDILWYFGAAIVYELASEVNGDVVVQPLTNEEWKPLLDDVRNDSLRGDVIIILMESMESWPLLQSEELSEKIAPNLMRFLKEEREHILYCTDVRSQVRHGVSGDGQMLVNTGMMPIRDGAACMLYADNVWPNIAGHYEHSVLINPSKYAWNQAVITPAYGYKVEVNQEDLMTDRQVFDFLAAVTDTVESPFCVQAITMETHTPFKEGRDVKLGFSSDMPQYMHDYLGCYHLADICLGRWLARVRNDERLRNATIVITGDHTIFKEAYLRDFHKFAKTSGWTIPEKESSCPLIIYSPQIEGRRIDQTLYQMDIYPTLRNWLGIWSEPWKGLGVDIILGQPRAITVESASALSERIIRTNGHKAKAL